MASAQVGKRHTTKGQQTSFGTTYNRPSYGRANEPISNIEARFFYRTRRSNHKKGLVLALVVIKTLQRAASLFFENMKSLRNANVAAFMGN